MNLRKQCEKLGEDWDWTIEEVNALERLARRIHNNAIEEAAKECRNHYPRPNAINQYWGEAAQKAAQIEERIVAMKQTAANSEE